MTRASLYARLERWRAAVTIALTVLLAAAAFFAWGPIGLGNGPLSVQMNVTQGSITRGPGPLGAILPVYNTAHATAVIDSVRLVGGTKYPGPHVIGLAVLASAKCGGAWPALSAPHGFEMIGCGGRFMGALIGHAVGFSPAVSPGFPAAAELTGPAPGTCWVSTRVVLHYHIGIRHWSATDRFQLAVCAEGSSNAAVTAAMNAAEQAGPS